VFLSTFEKQLDSKRREAFQAHRAAEREAAKSGLADLRMAQRARLSGAAG
jgi:hypothetical protein